jgi:cell division inhibitor SulA
VLTGKLRLSQQTRRSFRTGRETLVISHHESVVEWDQSAAVRAQDRGAAMAAALAPVQVSVAAEWVSRYSCRPQALQES